MGIVAKQTSLNVIIIAIAFAIGGLNTLVFYPLFLSAEEYGLVVFLLATSNLLMPLIGFGVHQTIIRFFSSYNTKEEQRRFMSSVILLPLFFSLIVGGVGGMLYHTISTALSIQNLVIANYTWVIFVIAVATAYFEVFYAWARVQLHSVAGNTLKEIFPRLYLFLLLMALYFFDLPFHDFIVALVIGYYLRLLLMIVLANRYYPLRIRLRLYFPSNIRSILTYSVTILLAGSAGSLIIDIDKFMIPQLEEIKQTAFYAVAIFAATIVEVPARAMWQILNPLVATAVNENNFKEVKSLYRRSALNLVVISGWFFLLVNLNSEALFSLLPNVGYQKVTLVVLYISLAKLITMIFGCGGAIISNSSFYQISLVFSVVMALGVSILNMVWIPLYGIDGAALATFVVVGLSIVVKILYIQFKIKVHPLSWNLLKTLFTVGILYTLFQYVEWAFSPIIKIVLTSALVSGLYFLTVAQFKLSDDLIRFVKRIRK
jgi:O-antigen/teichoic acid export membrane protein